jgi:hypothetical protein
MEELKIPEQLKGRWENALIFTYGLDATFFENALWREFGARCRNKIILADGPHYLEACGDYARSGLIRLMNTRYVAEGIFCNHAAHAKLILLTNSKQGRLLVGSGNLNMQGYASGGELFTQYDYSEKEAATLPAFLTIREFVNGLIEKNYIQGAARRYIRHLLENTPWIYQQEEAISPVRHNLNTSFFDQLNETINGEPVEELWVLSPFYDRELKALRRMLATWQPQQTNLLMQASATSVDAGELEKVVVAENGRCQVRAISRGGDNRYIHAKMYLLKLPNRAICLHGSPNLSQVAMLRTVDNGNIELANLLTGGRDHFDYILQALDINPAVSTLEVLDLSYVGGDNNDHEADKSLAYQLIRGEWHSNRLHLCYRGQLPKLADAVLSIAGHPITFALLSHQGYELTLKIAAEAADLLKRPVPVRLQWEQHGETIESNAVFVCNRDSLDATINAADDDEKLGQVGQLDIEDDEIEQLLSELENTLVLDQHDIWQVAGQPRRPPSETTDDETTPVSYDDIDYDVIRQHPRIQQYLERGRGGSSYGRSRLQIILNAITNHFRGLLDVADQPSLPDDLQSIINESEAQTEEEREQEEEERQRRKQSNRQRIQRIFKNFVKRYLHGLGSSRFQEKAGYEVMTQNYVVFSHLLWKLFGRDWVEPEFVIETQLRMWQIFWGGPDRPGYYRQLEETVQQDARQIILEYHGEGQLLAGIFYGSRLANQARWRETEFEIRDFWRHLLLHMPFALTGELLDKTWRIVAELIVYEPPQPTTIVMELKRLADLETENSFLRMLERTYDFGACAFNQKTKVGDFKGYITCLEVRRFSQVPNTHLARSVLSEWVRYEMRDYYRISFLDESQKIKVLRYNPLQRDGFFFNEESDEESDFNVVHPIRKPHDALLQEMAELAEQVESYMPMLKFQKAET